MMHNRLRLLLQAGMVFLSGALVSLRAEDYAITTFAGTTNVAGGVDGTPGTFNSPYGIAIDAAKNLYVTDTVGNTIRKITPGRVVSTLAGTSGLFGTTDGTGSAARFNFPVGIAVDAAGNVYVTDAKSFTIRKITPAGVVTTFAGAPFQVGSTNGAGGAARFYLPYGIAVDNAGAIYVADGGNHLIRKITPGGDVSTLAGGVQQPGLVDGAGTAARFNTPFGLALDSAGNLYVADSGNNAIRRITPAGAVTTVVGATGVGGATDGPVAIARLNQPRGIALDASGNIFVADFGNSVIRHISAGGNVTTLAGAPGLVGAVDSVGAAARFYDPTGIVVDGTTIYVADTTNNLIRRGLPASAAVLPVISVQPLDQEVSVGQAITLRVVATGSNLTYQWLKNGVAIGGATNSTYAIGSAQLSDIAAYTVRVSVAGGGTIDSAQANLSVTPAAGPIAITARPISQAVEPGQSVTFTVAATGSGLAFQWLKNGTAIPGATSASYTIASAQAGDAGTYTVRITSGATTETPTARLIVGGSSGAGITITSQPTSRQVAAGASTTFTVTASATGAVTYQWFKNDAAIGGATSSSYTIPSVQAGDVGNYRVRITGAGGSVDSDTASLALSGGAGPTSRLVNLSILTSIATAGETFTMGYVVGGAGTSGAKSILIRAAGPTLGAPPFGIPGALPDPKLELFAGQTKTGENDNWGGTPALMEAFSSTGAFAYVSGTSLDAASFGNIPPGDNSVKVSANASGTGTVIAEVYDATPFAALTSTSSRLVNVSVLKHLGTLLTVGFVIDGTGPKRVLIRAVGPTIGAAPFNVAGAVADPQLTLFSGQTAIGTNNNWGGTAELAATFEQVGAFGLPAASADAALVTTLTPGSYTVQVSGVGNTTGVAIVEVYEVP